MAGEHIQDDGDNMPVALMRSPGDMVDFEGMRLTQQAIQRIHEVRGVVADLRERLSELSNFNTADDVERFGETVKLKVAYLRSTGQTLD